MDKFDGAKEVVQDKLYIFLGYTSINTLIYYLPKVGVFDFHDEENALEILGIVLIFRYYYVNQLWNEATIVIFRHLV